ncbi:MAG: SDR family oxidoreductase [Bacteroidota bacterium]
MALSNHIGILGCGWLGLPLAQTLVSDGYTVSGTTTTPEKCADLERKGVTPYIVTLSEAEVTGTLDAFLATVDTLVVNIPPGLRRNPAENYVLKMTLLLRHIRASQVQQLLFVSSTSVYGSVSGTITEQIQPQPQTKSGQQLLQAEDCFREEPTIATTVVRFGGLLADDRHPVRRLSQKTLRNGNELVNLIHRDDCIRMIQTILKQGYWNSLFNGVYPHHPTKAVFYTAEAKRIGLAPPKYVKPDIAPPQRIVSSANFEAKGHRFIRPIVG